MKKNNLILILTLILTLGFTFSCKAQSQLEYLNTYTTDIVGTWISEDDSSHKIEFTSNGIYNIYINGNLEGTFEYSLATTCGSNSNNGYDIFLKMQTDITNYACDIVNNIHTDSDGATTLSITTERGQLEIYTKE